MNTVYKKSSFGPAFFFLKQAQKEALAAVYAFCRNADDIVDEPSENPAAQLNFWREETERIFKNSAQTDLGKELQIHVKKFNLSKENFLLLLDGMEMDLNKTSYKTFKELEKYLYRAAGVVGLMCCEITGFKKEEIFDYALTLGNAVQLTNIIRDVYEDIELGRVYLPREDMNRFKVTAQDIKNKNTAALAPLLAFEGERAREFFDRAGTLRPRNNKNIKHAVIMGNIYERLLKKMAGVSFSFTNKIRLSRIEKTTAALKAFLS